MPCYFSAGSTYILSKYRTNIGQDLHFFALLHNPLSLRKNCEDYIVNSTIADAYYHYSYIRNDVVGMSLLVAE